MFLSLKGFALSLASKQRLAATRKWPLYERFHNLVPRGIPFESPCVTVKPAYNFQNIE